MNNLYSYSFFHISKYFYRQYLIDKLTNNPTEVARPWDWNVNIRELDSEEGKWPIQMYKAVSKQQI